VTALDVSLSIVEPNEVEGYWLYLVGLLEGEGDKVYREHLYLTERKDGSLFGRTFAIWKDLLSARAEVPSDALLGEEPRILFHPDGRVELRLK